jgi:tRNA(adenine34) deaminase
MTGSSRAPYRFIGRRRVARALAVLAGALLGARGAGAQTAPNAEAERRWIALAFEMKRRAESWGDQPYGAVLVLDDALVGEGPSRVVQLGDPDAHAERVAIRDAQRRLGRQDLRGAILYSTSRPCARCERAAAAANVARMIHGSDLRDAGAPA